MVKRSIVYGPASDSNSHTTVLRENKVVHGRENLFGTDEMICEDHLNEDSQGWVHPLRSGISDSWIWQRRIEQHDTHTTRLSSAYSKRISMFETSSEKEFNKP
ncbi:hypothetical protein AMATHDRAFT_63323 [Amanita thiersii Skay4041]|uniref:Uncharacterized protein n=1 Tax=Amanita thiersii Skay4041 TaxID=703135 RepID=A0A2A9NNQ1_9AGAR|nr:hypothetical protein AMATHDRAFT_63323 [Amanita thiersii Skay4041]